MNLCLEEAWKIICSGVCNRLFIFVFLNIFASDQSLKKKKTLLVDLRVICFVHIIEHFLNTLANLAIVSGNTNY